MRPNSNHNLKGFAMPFAIGIGLMMVLVTITLLLKSQDNQVASIAQKQTSGSLSLAEGGISRTLGNLNDNYQIFLQLNYDPNNLLGNSPDGPDEWSNPPNPPPCFNSLADIVSGKIPASASAETYTVEAYRYSDPDGVPENGDETGTLLVKGHPLNSTAVTRIQQTMEVVRSDSPASFPGLMAQQISLVNNDVLGAIAGNVVCTDAANCVVPSSECADGKPTNDGLRSAIGALNNGVVQGKIFITEIDWPTVPTAPTGPLGDDDDDDDDDGASAAPTVSITGSSSFPRRDAMGTITDTLVEGAYHYEVSSISLSGTDILTIDTTSAPVYFYLNGDLTMSGSAVINHSCTGSSDGCGTLGSGLGSPERFRIYGLADDGDSSADQSITLNGGATATNVFIYAPDAVMGINGGSSSPDINGAIWVREWDGSSSNNAEITVPNNMKQLLEDTGFVVTSPTLRTSAAISWERKQTN
jgi:hypothetical protein